MAQWVKRLLVEHEDLNLDPQQLLESKTCNPTIEEMGTGRGLGLIDQSVQLNLGVPGSMRNPISKSEV